MEHKNFFFQIDDRFVRMDSLSMLKEWQKEEIFWGKAKMKDTKIDSRNEFNTVC